MGSEMALFGRYLLLNIVYHLFDSRIGHHIQANFLMRLADDDRLPSAQFASDTG